MRVLRFYLLPIVMLILWAVAHGQSSDKSVASSDAQESFDLLKTLAGTWQGPVMTDIPGWSADKPMSLSIRIGSHGNALIHELNTGTPEVTMFYVENDRLTLVHYCDYFNRPRLVALPSKNGKTVEFELVDFSGSNQAGHVSHGVFTIIDTNHHLEDWMFIMADGKPVHVHIDFRRVQ